MSRSINESINQLQTSLSDIKTSLSAKNVEGGEQIKVSEVAGLIDQIQSGSSGFKYIENVQFLDEPVTSPFVFNQMTFGDSYLNGTLKFTPKEDNIQSYYFTDNASSSKITSNQGLIGGMWNSLTKSTEYIFTFNSLYSPVYFVFIKDSIGNEKKEEMDFIAITMQN